MRSEQELSALLSGILEGGTLKKVTFSRSRDKAVKRAVAKLFRRGEELFCQIERFTADNKAYHENLPLAEAPARLSALAFSDFVQTDIVTTEGVLSVLVSGKGQPHVTDRRKSGAGAPEKVVLSSHNRAKHYLLDPVAHAGFLAPLGITDSAGRVFDKKQSKFKQINRFLELLDDVYPKLPAEGSLTVCDLCCGKSYLTFAVYYYLTEMKQRTLRMYGVDRKPDVIAYCSDLAAAVHCEGLTFLCQDVNTFDPGEKVDMVVSLHACDIATDMVLDFAVRKRVQVVLSTPCCHHEMMGQLTCPSLSFLTGHSLLKQKLCDAATDALRALKLEAFGYAVEVLELIDAEETPKNVMIRAYRLRHADPVRCRLARTRYREAVSFLGVSPYLGLSAEKTDNGEAAEKNK